ncbi:AraC family transcriptional regulator [Dyadobacter sp. CY261]|uniref:helix-turn-helix domain-containing protein n=1 Tax=Dyadobacter sp. CY261 TaxID=2907203 RepID=UPI001F357482|nr:AraC family transcriptional regulator [Dyadobacter sp. CY261]MCF0074899.1 AraC family transcriptional regulator [Dyadobacter sp. CY261]
MIYKKIAPCILLKPFVETFFVWETSINHSSIPKIESPPTGFASMVFNYGSTYKVDNIKKGEITVPASFVTGQQTKKYQISLLGDLGMIGIVFKPSALFTILGIPMYEFNDERISLSDILGVEADYLLQHIQDSTCQLQRLEILERYLIKLLQKSPRSPDRTDHIANLIHERHGVLSTQDLMKELYVCHRQFQRLFLMKVGVSAKYFARICRVSDLCARMAAKKWDIADWNDLVHHYGYYDQSHFIKEFAEFMGKAPSGYIRSNQELANYVDTSKVRMD